MAKIYTKTGDKGETTVRGKRVAKDDQVIEAVGTLDELNSMIGLARAGNSDKAVDSWLERIQKNIFSIGAEIATGKTAMTEAHVSWLEEKIDLMEAELPALGQFILPGGSEAAANIHLARTVCRRAERRLVEAGVGEIPLAYLNRLADFLFVLGRWINHKNGEPETKWYAQE